MAKSPIRTAPPAKFFFNLRNNSQPGRLLEQRRFHGLWRDCQFGQPDRGQRVGRCWHAKPGDAPALPATEQGVFNEIPLQNYTGTSFPTDTTAANYALLRE